MWNRHASNGIMQLFYIYFCTYCSFNNDTYNQIKGTIMRSSIYDVIFKAAL